MKRFAKAMSLLLAVAVLVGTASTSVSATTPSVTNVGAAAVSSVSGIEASKVTIVATSSALSGEVQVQYEAALAEVAAVENASQLVDTSSLAAEAGVSATDFVIADVIEVSIPENPDGNVVEITMESNLTPGQYYAWIHRDPETGVWSVTNTGYADAQGRTVIRNDKFSPYALVTLSSASSTAKTSPQTGETANVALIAALALAATATVVVVSGRKVTR